jgi:hypothetical protein
LAPSLEASRLSVAHQEPTDIEGYNRFRLRRKDGKFHEGVSGDVDGPIVICELHIHQMIKQTEAFRRWHLKLRDEKAKALIAARILDCRSHLGLPLASCEFQTDFLVMSLLLEGHK